MNTRLRCILEYIYMYIFHFPACEWNLYGWVGLLDSVRKWREKRKYQKRENIKSIQNWGMVLRFATDNASSTLSLTKEMYKVWSIGGLACLRNVAIGILLRFLFLLFVLLFQAGNHIAVMVIETKLKQGESLSEITSVCKAFLNIKRGYWKVHLKTRNLLW